ncbi:PWWP domain-containing DNA repair factor 3A [Boleophthalmus pectinirostris]|uniref:PWWP domain-containing DNA repair factor 3A n=1 Tax=Boleophthalmus pectinirostris TaxID=150288 RepID=UPI000A1C3D24|nr:PWWP domain-containing DNA repair factor 3A [Boleophthalmus pectinirostris]
MTDIPGMSSVSLLTPESPGNLALSGTVLKPLECTPRRSIRKFNQNQEQCMTSTPVGNSLKDLSELSSPSPEKIKKISDTESPVDRVKRCNWRRGQKPRQLRTIKQRACVKNKNSHAKPKSGRKTNSKEHFTEQTRHSRPRLNLDSSSSVEQDELPSSDLSIELSVHEEPQPHLSFQEDEGSQEDEEDEFPSFLMVDTKSSIIAGGFVWYKFRNYPFWPAMVKRVNHKMKRASILIVEEKFIQQKRGFLVSLKTLKPYECEEFKELICKAKEKYNVAIQWSIDLIEDYIMRKGIGSFSGSFIEYYAHNISYPVRRKYQSISERLTFANDIVVDETFSGDDLDDSFNEPQEEDVKHAKRLLPDRTHAAHTRANEKLVYFIVKQHMVDQHLMAVMCGQRQSKWLCLFLSARRRKRGIVNIYLEDDEQLDRVYWHLSKLYTTAAETDSCLESIKRVDHVPFVLDVLLPEALIHAIAGVDHISIKKAEEKYLKGRCVSNRERQEFDLMIEQQMKTKSAATLL